MVKRKFRTSLRKYFHTSAWSLVTVSLVKLIACAISASYVTTKHSVIYQLYVFYKNSLMKNKQKTNTAQKERVLGEVFICKL